MAHEIELGYVLRYYPETSVIDFKSFGGQIYNSIGYDPSMGCYVAPVEPIISNDEISRPGSFLYFTKITDSIIKILSIFNDDSLMQVIKYGKASPTGNITIVDPLQKMMDHGDSMYSALGKIRYKDEYRRFGSWMLLKANGGVILSDADSSTQFTFKPDGTSSWITSEYNISGNYTSIFEDDNGDLNLEGDNNVYFKAPSIQFDTTDNSLTLKDGYGLTGALESLDINVNGNGEINVPNLNVNGREITINADNTFTINITGGITLTLANNMLDIQLPSSIANVTIGRGGNTYPVVVYNKVITPDSDTVINDISDLSVSDVLFASISGG